MKNYIMIGLILQSLFCLSQTATPMFMDTLYFEDAVGNKDTLWVGYDSAAICTPFAPKFGEIEITSPFDSVFEVRIMQDLASPQNYQTFKRLILAYENSEPLISCGVWGTGGILIQSKYPPVTIRYDSTKYDLSGCHANTIFTPTPDVFVMPEWFWASNYHCLGSSHAYILDTANIEETIQKEVEGLGMQGVPLLYFTNFLYGPCGAPIIGTHEVSSDLDLRIWPNPASDEVQIEDKSGLAAQMVVYNVWGQAVMEQKKAADQSRLNWNTKDWQPGIYFVTMHHTDGSRGATRLVKN
jgi:hypothetical protein